MNSSRLNHCARDERIIQREKKEQAKQHSIQGLSPLPRRTAPRRWEDLASVITRTAHVMGYPQPGWILRPEKAGHSISSEALPLLKWQLDYELLRRLLDLDEETLHNLTLYRFAERIAGMSGAIRAETAATQGFPRLTKLPRLWNAQRLFAYSGQTTQLCPHCLNEPYGYDRLYWRATPVLLCQRHRVWLINSCPTCHKPIRTLRPKLGICPFCGGDYRQHILPLSPQTRPNSESLF
jgi:hypothetical protein